MMLPPTYIEGFHDLEAVKAMKYENLGKTDLLISKLSIGGGPFGCHYGDYDENEAIEAIQQAIKQGINYIDTAPWYGQGKSEKVIGKALKGIPRQAYYIATKVGRYELDTTNMFDFSKEKTRLSFENSLKRLGLDYIDVIQVHDIEFAPSLNIVISQTLPELSKQIAEKKARYIGITGYPLTVLKECIEQSNINIACVLTYSRLSLLDDTLIKFISFFKKHNIGVINAAVLAMGLLTNNGPPAWHPASEEMKNICTSFVQYCKVIITNYYYREDHNVDVSKLAIWYAMKYEDTATTLIGIQNLQQLKISLDILRNGITKEEQELLYIIKDKYISKIKCKHWEGKEVEAYWHAMKI